MAAVRPEETTAADWEQTMALNVVHPAVLMRAALPHLRKSGRGRVICIGGTAGREWGAGDDRRQKGADCLHKR